MTEDAGQSVTEQGVRELARVAGLGIDEERVVLLAPQLNDLLRDANLVNRFMAERREVGPAVRFVHEEVRGREG